MTYLIVITGIQFFLVDAEESPTVVLDRADVASQRQPLVSSDPFRDVIKTEPAPDLPSLIEDMIPYLAGQGIGTSNSTNAMNSSTFETVEGSQMIDFQHHNQSEDVEQKFPDSANEFYRHNETQLLIPLENNSSSEITLQSNFVITNNQSEKNSSIFKEDENTLTIKENFNKTAFFQEEDDSGFSLDSVLDLFFSDITTAAPKEVTQSKLIKQANVKNKTIFQENPLFKQEPELEAETNSTISTESGKGGKLKEVTTPKKNIEFKTDIEEEKIWEKVIIQEESMKNESIKELDTGKVKSNTKLKDSSSYLSTNLISKGKISFSTTPISIHKNYNVNLNPETKAKNTEKDVLGLNVLKLAGCNIYGRMYRVGRIITELSSSCRECRCTDVGVQCKQLNC